MEIIDRIKTSPQNLRAAKEIFSVFKDALWSLKKECFEKVEKKVQEKNQINPDENKFHYKHFLTDENYAGIFYKINENNGVRFNYEEEIRHGYAGFFVGYCSPSGDWTKNWDVCTIEYEKPEETLYELCNDVNMEKFTDKCANKIIELLNNNGA